MKPDPSTLTKPQLEELTRHFHSFVVALLTLEQGLYHNLTEIEELPEAARNALNIWREANSELLKRADLHAEGIISSNQTRN